MKPQKDNKETQNDYKEIAAIKLQKDTTTMKRAKN